MKLVKIKKKRIFFSLNLLGFALSIDMQKYTEAGIGFLGVGALVARHRVVKPANVQTCMYLCGATRGGVRKLHSTTQITAGSWFLPYKDDVRTVSNNGNVRIVTHYYLNFSILLKF